MKKKTIHLLGFIEFLILLSTLLFFVLASDKSMIFFIDKVTSAYDIRYEKLEGNLLKNITLYGITYKDRQLAKKAHIDINFKALLRAKLKMDDITLQEVDLNIVEKMITDQNSGKSTKLKNIPTISITSIFFSSKPYQAHDLNISNIKFIANDIKGDLTDLTIGAFSFYTESDYTNITANGKIENKILDFEHLWITDIDIEKIIQFYKKRLSKQNDTNSTKRSAFKNLINKIKIDNFKTDIKAYNYKKYEIKKLLIKAEKLHSDFESISANTNINIVTNMWKLTLDGKLNDNRLIADADVKLNDRYFKKFVPFFNHDKITKLKTDFIVDKDKLYGNVFLKSDNLMTGKLKELDLRVNDAKAKAVFNFKPIDLDVNIDGNLSTKYTKSIKLTSNLHYDKKDKFSYNGTLFSKDLQNIDENISNLMKDTKVTFYGDTKKIQAEINNDNLSADYNSTIYRRGLLTLNTKKIIIDNYIKMPKNLVDLKASIKAKIPIDFKNLTKYNSSIEIDSNALNIKGDLIYDKGFKLNSTIDISSNSILRDINDNLKISTLFPLKSKASWIDSLINTDFSNGDLTSTINYDTKTKTLDTKLSLSNDTFALKGDINGDLFFKASTISLKSLQENISKFYRFKKEPLDGEVVINGIIHSKDDIDLNIKSRWFVYEYRANKFAFAEKIKIDINRKDDLYQIKNYYFSTYLDYDRVFFAKKPSLISFKNSKIVSQTLWVNDQATIVGEYDISKSNGSFHLNTKSYHYNGIEGDIYADASIYAILLKDSIKIEGNVDVLKGVVTYKAKKEHYIQDDDIIIVQEERAKKEAKKKSKLLVDVAILSKNPISYKVDDTDVVIDFDLKFWKEKDSELELLGIAKLLSGTHFEAKKEFKVENGEILFAGPILNPFLNINVSHLSDPYKITININGLLDSPIINFNSTPFLTQSDILSILLFDSTTEDLFSSSGDSSKAAISMFGNTFAKELVENFGIKLDKLVLSTNEEGGFGLEIGKKISRKITIIYINDIVQTIKVKYQNSKKFETDITFSPNTSGIDFLYKNEY